LRRCMQRLYIRRNKQNDIKRPFQRRDVACNVSTLGATKR
jgi:hypothetical protein